jgi:hypothetical protein
VFQHGEQQEGLFHKAFFQLQKPDPQNAVYTIGMSLPKIASTTSFRCSPELHKELTPHLEQRMIFNCTPEGSDVDLHTG